MRFLKKLAPIGLLLLFPLGASATLLTTDLYGDKDGLGIGVLDGQAFDFTQVTADDAADVGTITDSWMFGNQTWSHTYSLYGRTVVGATLEVFTGGQGWFGLSSLFVDDVFVGYLTDGDGFDGGDEANRGRLDIFDLSAYLGLINGAETIRVDTVLGGDGWALDYSELRVESVPEPSSLALLGLALIGLGWMRRK